MRAVVQRVSRACVRVDGRTAGSVGRGLMVLLGVATGDDDAAARWMAEKIVSLRIFRDEAGLMNRSVLEEGGGVLLVSQFTLLGDVRKGRRPSFVAAAPEEFARPLYERVGAAIAATAVPGGYGEFGAPMEVEHVNDGAVTILQ
ncbi:MAG: D-aminoacyl-tRNA deacylase, partial [Vulcanimicrobiaceae bacterium]